MGHILYNWQKFLPFLTPLPSGGPHRALGPQEFPTRTGPRSCQPFLHSAGARQKESQTDTLRYGIVGRYAYRPHEDVAHLTQPIAQFIQLRFLLDLTFCVSSWADLLMNQFTSTQSTYRWIRAEVEAATAPVTHQILIILGETSHRTEELS